MEHHFEPIVFIFTDFLSLIVNQMDENHTKTASIHRARLPEACPSGGDYVTWAELTGSGADYRMTNGDEGFFDLRLYLSFCSHLYRAVSMMLAAGLHLLASLCICFSNLSASFWGCRFPC